MPDCVVDYYGFHHKAGESDTAGVPALYELNDDGWSFERIAEQVESNPGLYFKESK